MSIRFEYTRKLPTGYTRKELETAALLLEQSRTRAITESLRTGSTEEQNTMQRRIHALVVETLQARMQGLAPNISLDDTVQEILNQRFAEIVTDSGDKSVGLLLESNSAADDEARYRALALLRGRLSEDEAALASRLTERLRATQPTTAGLLLELAGYIDKLWPPSTDVLRVYFFGGQNTRTAKVLGIANQWHDHCRIRFEATDDIDKSDIRVSFEPGGSWSYIGKDAQDAALVGNPTMNFSVLTTTISEEEYQQVVLHEFGHALGMVHEHQAGVPPIQWSVGYVQMWCSGPPNNWTADDVQRNIFHRYQQSETNHSGGMDMASIMIYRVPEEFTINRIWFPSNHELSKRDKEHIAKIYPKVSPVNS